MFADQGFLVLPSAVEQPLVHDALRAINSWIDERHDAAHRDSYRTQSYAPELTRSPVVTRLLTEGSALRQIEALVGRHVTGSGHGQIALRFPSPSPGGLDAPHIDGVPTPGNGLEPGRLHGFTALAGVMLSDVSAGGQGNLTVWPGSHLRVADVLRRRGWVVDDGAALLDELAEVAAAGSAPVEVLARPGDVVVAQYLLLHTVGRHTSPHVRYAVYFRLTAEEQPSTGFSHPHP